MRVPWRTFFHSPLRPASISTCANSTKKKETISKVLLLLELQNMLLDGGS